MRVTACSQQHDPIGLNAGQPCQQSCDGYWLPHLPMCRSIERPNDGGCAVFLHALAVNANEDGVCLEIARIIGAKKAKVGAW